MSLTLTDLALPERIASKLDEHGGIPVDPHTPVEGECWTLDTWHNSAGYPYLSWDGRDQPAHRIVYALTTGADLVGLDLDHLCRNVACVNPAHEEPVTHAENQARIRKHQTACRKAGHDWADPKNVYVRPNGRRYCAACARTYRRARWAQKGF